MRIHPVFHVGLLEPFRNSDIPNREEIRPEPEDVEGELEWQVEEILGSIQMGDGTVEYLVKWKGYDISEATQEPFTHLEHAQDKLKEFHRRKPKEPKDSRFQPPRRR